MLIKCLKPFLQLQEKLSKMLTFSLLNLWLFFSKLAMPILLWKFARIIKYHKMPSLLADYWQHSLQLSVKWLTKLHKAGIWWNNDGCNKSSRSWIFRQHIRPLFNPKGIRFIIAGFSREILITPVKSTEPVPHSRHANIFSLREQTRFRSRRLVLWTRKYLNETDTFYRTFKCTWKNWKFLGGCNVNNKFPVKQKNCETP